MKYKYTYSMMDMMLADPNEPTPLSKQTYQLTRMWEGLRAIEQEQNPTYDDWQVVSDALNLMETLVEMGWAKDPNNLIEDAVKALAIAGQRHIDTGAPIRLNGEGIVAVRGLLEDYAEALKELPHRTMIACHRKTEKRIQDIIYGRRKDHDVTVHA